MAAIPYPQWRAERAMMAHQQRIKDIQTRESEFKVNKFGFSHLRVNYKRLQMLAEKEAEIQRENVILFDRLKKAEHKLGNSGHVPVPRSLNKTARDREKKRIEKDNLALLYRLETEKSVYDFAAMQASYEAHRDLLSRRSRVRPSTSHSASPSRKSSTLDSPSFAATALPKPLGTWSPQPTVLERILQTDAAVAHSLSATPIPSPIRAPKDSNVAAARKPPSPSDYPAPPGLYKKSHSTSALPVKRKGSGKRGSRSKPATNADSQPELPRLGPSAAAHGGRASSAKADRQLRFAGAGESPAQTQPYHLHVDAEDELDLHALFASHPSPSSSDAAAAIQPGQPPAAAPETQPNP